MNTPIDQTYALIMQAYEQAEHKFLINEKAEAELFSKLNLIAEPGEIPLLLPLVFSNHKRLSETIANLIHKIIIKMPVDAWEALDERIRKKSSYYSISNYQSRYKITVNSARRLNFEKPVCNTIYILLCSHYNGYVREEAIKALLPEFSIFNIPILLIRANDWVTKIKLLANTKLIEFIDENKISDFIPSLNLIARLCQKGRYDHSILINLIESQLIKKCYDKLLLTVASLSNRKISRAAFRIAAKNSSKIPQLIQASSQSQDIIIKLETVDVANQYLSDDMLFEFLGRCLADQSPIIRRKCIHICLEKFPQQINHILINTLFDQSFSLRELARFYLKDSDNHIQKIYQEAFIHKNKPLDIAIMGLAEVGNQDNFEFIKPHLHDTDLNVRAACLYAIFKLNPDNKQALILDQLASSHEPKIIKTIYTGLIKNSDDVDMDAIENVFCQQGDLYSEILFIKMKIAIIKAGWSLIDFMLDHVQRAKNDPIKFFLEKKIARWIVTHSPNRVFTRPNQHFLISLMAKVDQLILQDNNADLYNALKKNIMYFME